MPILWIRWGDNSDYHLYDALEDFVAKLQELGISKLERCAKYGVTDHDLFKELNYISCFYGDEEAQPLAQLPDIELRLINDSL